MKIKVKCKKCGKEWKPRSNPPRICRYCKTKYWNVDKKIKIQQKDSSFLENKTYGKVLLVFGKYAGALDGLKQEDFQNTLSVGQADVSKLVNKLWKNDFVTVNGRYKKRYLLNYDYIITELFSQIEDKVKSNINERIEFLQKEEKKEKELKFKKGFDRVIKEEEKKKKKISLIKIDEHKQLLIDELKNTLFQLYHYEVSKSGIKDITITKIFNTFLFNLLPVLDLYPSADNLKLMIREYQNGITLKHY